MSTSPLPESPIKTSVTLGDASTQSPVKVSQSQEDSHGAELVNSLPEHIEEDDVMSDHMPDDTPDQQTQIKLSQALDQYAASQSRSTPATQIRRQQTRTPEPKLRRSQKVEVQPSPSTPGHLAPFDWEDFEARYSKALENADEHERALLEEFEGLVKYFNMWASATSSHDTTRAVKRLQTRSRYVHLSEGQLQQKKAHLQEVVKAFQSALALLRAS